MYEWDFIVLFGLLNVYIKIGWIYGFFLFVVKYIFEVYGCGSVYRLYVGILKLWFVGFLGWCEYLDFSGRVLFVNIWVVCW